MACDPSSFSLGLGKNWYHVDQGVDRTRLSGLFHVSKVMNEPSVSPTSLGLPTSFDTYRKAPGPTSPLS